MNWSTTVGTKKDRREIDQETDPVLGGCDLRPHACIFCRVVPSFSPFTQPKDLLIARFEKTSPQSTERHVNRTVLFIP